MSALPTLSSSRLSLRPLNPGDVPTLFAIFSDPEVVRFWSSPPLPDLRAARRLLRDVEDGAASGSLFQWGIDVPGIGIVGTCTLASMERRHRRAEIGFALGRVHQGAGYMREALSLLLRHAFTALNLHRIEADVDPRNAASIRLLERFGFRLEGRLRERYHLASEIQDTLMYGLLRSEAAAELITPLAGQPGHA